MDIVWSSIDAIAGRQHFKKTDGPYSICENGVWRNAEHESLSHFPFEGCDTLYSTFQFAVSKHHAHRAVGTRPLIKSEQVPDAKDPSKKFEKLTLGDYEWLNYEQFGRRVDAAATGLAGWAGLGPGMKVVIYAETKADWQVVAQACFRQSAIVATIYATLGEQGVAHGVNQTKAPVIVIDAKLFKTLLAVAPSCPNLKYVVTLGTVPAEQAAQLPAGIKVKAFAELLATGGSSDCVEAAPPKPDDLAVIMYTSGTTGAPKGVCISHANVCASMAGLRDGGRYDAKTAWPTTADTYLAYLPLAHIMELAAECVMFACGSAVGYGSPQTLTDTGLKLAPGCAGDAPLLKPTFMVFPPTILDRVRQGVQAKVGAAGGVAAYLFGQAEEAANRDFESGLIGAPPLWDVLCFKKVQQALGGRVQVMLTGSAPLSAETQRFIQGVFGAPVRQGYGLTETCSAGTLGAFDDNGWSCGRVLSSVRLKLVDWEEGGYRNSDKDDPAIGVPRGEVWIGGPVVAKGYYIDEAAPDADLVAANATEFSTDPDGTRWFHTGDIGQMTELGLLQIVDRKKDLVKLQMGEYVALSKVENAMKLCPFVEQALCYARSSEECVVALVCPAEKPLLKWAEAAGKPHTTLAEVCADPDALAEVSACVAKAVKGKLAPFEVPVKIGLLPEARISALKTTLQPWTPENDMVTAALKLKRMNIVKANAKLLDELYVAAKAGKK